MRAPAPHRGVLATVVLLLVAGCGTAPGGPSTAPSAAAAPSPMSTAGVPARSSSASRLDGMFDVGGYRLRLVCAGQGSPVVVLDAGLSGTSTTWLSVQEALAREATVCRYDRAGLGSSDARPGNSPTSAGAMASELWRLLEAAGIDGPIVLAGHSYGGMIVRLAARDHPDAVRGLLLVDSASVRQFEGDWLANDRDWFDGNAMVDRQTSARELAQVTSLGSIPLVVLTQGQMSGPFVRDWSRVQDELAALSTNALHLVAKDSGHTIQEEAPELVVASAKAIVDAVRSGGDIPACGPTFEAVGAECLATTMSDQVKAWDRLRESVVATPGTFPAGVYRSELSADLVKEMTGQSQDWTTEVHTWKVTKGQWTVTIVTDGGAPDSYSGVYASSGDELTVRIPDDWTIPRTPGVNRLRWTIGPNGTIHFAQIDDEVREPAFAVPWVPMPDS